MFLFNMYKFWFAVAHYLIKTSVKIPRYFSLYKFQIYIYIFETSQNAD